VRNDSEFGYGWLYQNPKSPENIPKNAKKQSTEKRKKNVTEV